MEDLVPADHFYRYLDAKLNLSFVRTWVQDCYATGGRPSIDPVVFFKLQLILFFEGLRSERKLLDTVALNLAHRWYLGYHLDEVLPDHSSLTRIRERLGLPLFQRFFARVVELCQQAGLVWGAEIFFDGTKVQANAEYDSLVPRWYAAAKTHLDMLFADETASSAPPDSVTCVPTATLSAAAPTRLPFTGTAASERELAVANDAAWRLLDEHRLDPDRPPSGPYRRITDFRVSTTDPDAAPLRSSSPPRLGYHDHSVVDGGKARIILAALVTPADVQDNQVMIDRLDRVRFRYQLHVRHAVGDSKYATGDNLRQLAERGIRASMPVVDDEQATRFFRHKDFVFDREADTYRCPQGTTLTFRGNNDMTRVRSYAAPTSVCAACPVRVRCTDSTSGRRVNRPFDEDYRERLRELEGTVIYQKALRKRAVWIEPLVGEAKAWHGLRKFRLRGRWKVNCEGLRIATGQNLKRWLTKTGWGRRHGPAGSLALAHRPPPVLIYPAITWSHRLH
ncbi:MAG TPA: IS1182 family transposase [Thermomicrobiales bacterium]|nr:IS1182 family transposase [Thermomicrobiales bacterium]